jgi:Transglutaminase-like superfamily/Coenzyme PQQ synthesis protein D (PqqD)
MLERNQQTAHTQFVIAPDVCSSSDSDGTTILDIKNDRIYNAIGLSSLIWSKLATANTGLSQSAIVDTLRTEFIDVPEQQIESDVDHLLSDFKRKNLINESRAVFVAGSEECHFTSLSSSFIYRTTEYLLKLRLSGLAAFLGLAMSTFVLKLRGFGALHRMVKRWPVNDKQPDSKSLDEICTAVDSATSWYPKHALCLSRSAVTTCLLKQQGIDARMVIGCNKIPFKAHAWVEVNGEVVNDRKRVQQTYKVLDRT